MWKGKQSFRGRCLSRDLKEADILGGRAGREMPAGFNRMCGEGGDCWPAMVAQVSILKTGWGQLCRSVGVTRGRSWVEYSPSGTSSAPQQWYSSEKLSPDARGWRKMDPGAWLFLVGLLSPFAFILEGAIYLWLEELLSMLCHLSLSWPQSSPPMWNTTHTLRQIFTHTRVSVDSPFCLADHLLVRSLLIHCQVPGAFQQWQG